MVQIKFIRAFAIFFVFWMFSVAESQHRYASPYQNQYSYPQNRYRMNNNNNNVEIVEGTIDQLSNIDPKWVCRNTKTGDQIIFGTEVLNQYVPTNLNGQQTTGNNGYYPGQHQPNNNNDEYYPTQRPHQQIPGYNPGNQQVPGYNPGTNTPTNPYNSPYRTIEELMNAYPHLDWSKYTSTMQTAPPSSITTTPDPREVSGELVLEPRIG